MGSPSFRVKVGKNEEKSLSFVGRDKNTIKSAGGQAMCTQDSTEKEAIHEQGIVVPLE